MNTNEPNVESDCGQSMLNAESESEGQGHAFGQMLLEKGTSEPVYPPDYHQITYDRINSRESNKRTLTAAEASEYVLNFTRSDILVINFIKVCYEAMSKIAPSEEKELLNLIIPELRVKLNLNAEMNWLARMTELTMLLKDKFLPYSNPLTCINKIKEIYLGKGESIYPYILRFQYLHTMILDYEIRCAKPNSNIKSIVDRLESEHIKYFCYGSMLRYNFIFALPNRHCSLNEFLTDVIVYIRSKTRFRECDSRLRREEKVSNVDLNSTVFEKQLCILEEDPEESRINEMFSFPVQAPASKVISGSVLDEHTKKTGMLKAEEAGEIVPCFNGSEHSIYDFLEVCHIALSNISYDQEQGLVRIIISRLQGRVAELVKWTIITSFHDLMKILKTDLKYRNDSLASRKVKIIYMNPNKSVNDYIAKFKKLYVLVLLQKITSKPNQPMKDIISSIGTLCLIEFIKGFASTSFTPYLPYNGFHDFLEKVVEQYNTFITQPGVMDQIAVPPYCTSCLRHGHRIEHCRRLQRVPTYSFQLKSVRHR